MFDRKSYKSLAKQQSSALSSKMALVSAVCGFIIVVLALVSTVIQLNEVYGFFKEKNSSPNVKLFVMSLLFQLVFGTVTNVIGFAASRFVYQYRRNQSLGFGNFLKSFSWNGAVTAFLVNVCMMLWNLPTSLLSVFAFPHITALMTSAHHFAFLLMMLFETILIIYMIIATAYVVSYSLSCFVSAENNAVSPLQAIRLSMKISKGCRENIFVMMCSFVLWCLFAIITLGIGAILFMPYIENSWINCYEAVKANALETGAVKQEEFNVL